jgi:hypothetical protein
MRARWVARHLRRRRMCVHVSASFPRSAHARGVWSGVGRTIAVVGGAATIMGGGRWNGGASASSGVVVRTVGGVTYSGATQRPGILFGLVQVQNHP